jgi:hypothetical protein
VGSNLGPPLTTTLLNTRKTFLTSCIHFPEFEAIFDFIFFICFQTPTFTPETATISFSEEAVVGTRRLLEPATIDVPGRIVSYEILEDPSSPFRIHETRSADGSEVSYLHLETREKLDREKRASFKLKVSATSADGDKGYLTLSVEVLDINDNPPVFDDNEYRVSVNDSLEIGSAVVQTVATDADEGKNGRISYHMPDEFASHFDLVIKKNFRELLFYKKNPEKFRL